MKRLQRWSVDQVAGVLARAAAAGHDVNELRAIRRGTPGSSHGTIAVCTCGWTSTPRRPATAALAAMFHAHEVCAILDDRKHLDGFEWTAAPASPALRSLMTRTDLPTSHHEAS